MELKEIAMELAHRTCTKYHHVPDSSSVQYSFSARHLADFVEKLIARVDQERGKDAAAWRIETGYERPRYFYQAAKPDRFIGNPEPLFLSPTIPAGYALVPIEPTQEMCEQAYYEFNAEQKDFDAANLYRAMIKAAQEGVTK